MTEWLGNHLWQSTLFGAGAAALAFALRTNRAQVRYWVWVAASLKFLLPFSVLIAIGAWLAPQAPALATPERHQVAAAMSAVAQPFTPADPATRILSAVRASSTNPDARDNRWLLAAVWFAGFVGVLAVWLTRWRRVASIARQATAMHDGREAAILRRLERRAGRRPVPLLVATSVLEPGAFGIVRPVLLWPHSIGQRLDDAQIESILAHELSHLRRRDNLVAAVHTVVQAAFWFHPLVWWLGSRLVAEREQACDEEVLRLGSEPDVYAASILKTCEFYLEAPQACVAGVTGADLRRRIESIMGSRAADALTNRRKALLAGAAAVSVIVPVTAGVLTARPLAAVVQVSRIEIAAAAPSPQAPTAPPRPDMRFEVASVKPNNSGDGRVSIGFQPGGRFTAVNAPLRMLIRNAYQLQDFQLVNAPDWISDERFDITARGEGSLPPVAPGEVGPIQIMMKNLLADRFKLVTRSETREMPIYALVLARSDKRLGPQLKPSSVDCPALAAARARGGPPPVPPPAGERPQCGLRMGPGAIVGGGMPLRQLAAPLSQLLGRVVVDRTGLDGGYDIDLKWTPDQRPQGAPVADRPLLPAGDPDGGASLFTALQEQLGLKLDPQRGTVDVLVIESVERPTPD